MSESEKNWLSYLEDSDLKGEELAAKFEWPYDDPIDLSNATVKRYIEESDVIGQYEVSSLSEISNKSTWFVRCDYGYLAMMPESGSEYEYKKYKAGDKIGDYIVVKIHTLFDNVNFEFKKYFVGLFAQFEGEVTLTGEMAIIPPSGEFQPPSEIYFYPDEESRKKLPVVNFAPKLNGTHFEEFYPTHDDLSLELGYRTDYPEIDFGNILTDGTRVNVKIKIKKYGYRAEFGTLPFESSATMIDGSLEIL